MPTYLSGIQPTGKFHIGNYFGCIKPFLSINRDETLKNGKNIFLIADMHCYTKPEKANNINQNVHDAVRSLLAAGVDPERTHIVQQSKVTCTKFDVINSNLDIRTCKSFMVSFLPYQVFSCSEHDTIQGIDNFRLGNLTF